MYITGFEIKERLRSVRLPARLAVWSICIVSMLTVPDAIAGINVGSDGSDGALDLTGQSGTVVIDLSQAAEMCDCNSDGMANEICTWDCPSPVPGQGVYDADQWAVVLKYTTIRIPFGVRVEFGRHNKNAPVVMLVQNDVDITGTIDLRGAQGYNFDASPIIPFPQPGAFRGGAPGTTSSASGGEGPGGGEIASSGYSAWGGSGSYATVGTASGSNNLQAPQYGTEAVIPLIGGSGGGGGAAGVNSGSGGSGGGAILIASNQDIDVFPGGIIDARGGDAGMGTSTNHEGGSGSGGAIRMIANQISIQGTAQLLAAGGTGNASSNPRTGGLGHIRLEGSSVNISIPDATLDVDPSIAAPTIIFPPTDFPKLRATTVGSQPVPTDPSNNAATPDVTLTSCNPVNINIAAENIATGFPVKIRIVPEQGRAMIVLSDGLNGTFASSTATASGVSFPTGTSSVQLSATASLSGSLRSPQTTLTPSFRNLKTVAGERITNVKVTSDADGRSTVVYITESGQRIPVGSR